MAEHAGQSESGSGLHVQAVVPILIPQAHLALAGSESGLPLYVPLLISHTGATQTDWIGLHVNNSSSGI